MNKKYHIVSRADQDSASVAKQFCEANGQILLPVVEFLERGSLLVEGVIHQMGVGCLEALLRMSAAQVAGAPTPGKASGDVRWYGSQPGRVPLGDRSVMVKRPRLRHKTEGEVPVPL